MADLNNSTEQNVQEVQEVHSGEQENVVDSQESYNSVKDDFKIVDTDDNQAGVVDQLDTDEEDDADTGEGAVETDSDGADQKEHHQTREDNAAAKAARLRATREAEARAAKARTDAQAEVNKRFLNANVLNPYTGKPFGSIEEFEDYGQKLRQAEIAKKAKETGKSVEQLTEEERNADYIRRKRQEESEAENKRQEEDKRKEFFRNDLMNFMERYPAVDVSKLDNNQQFRKFCGSRYGKEPLADLYENYVELMGDASKVATMKAEAKSARSTGTGERGGEVLNPAQKRALDEWNKQNPEMAMTPKEFLSR